MRALSGYVLLILCLCLGLNASSQTRYRMQNGTVTECEGILVDSEAGNDPLVENRTGYAQNEDYCFTICVPNSPNIKLNFSYFSLEVPGPGESPCNGCDFLEVYDGPNCTGTRLGRWEILDNPGSVSSSGSCISIRFRSDGNKTGNGFQLSWIATPPPPVAPVIAPIPNVSCKSNSVVITFDQPIRCSELVPGKFTFTGPAGATVSSVTPVNCVNGYATSAVIGFSGPLDQSGTYNIVFDFVYTDICNRTYRMSISQSFNIIDCPLEVEIIGNYTVCQGYCINLTARVRGGNPANYQYTWSPAAPNQAVISICPTADIVYRLTVTDGASIPASDTHNIRVLSIPNAGPNDSLCLFAAAKTYTGTPPGGRWTGPGIVDGNNGIFNPPSAGYGTHNIFYIGPNGCPDTMQVTVWPVWAGGNQSACEGTAPFQLNGYPTPATGLWTGPNTTASGMFTPSPSGTYQISYTEPVHNCVSTTVVTVVPGITLPPNMSVCSVTARFNIVDKGPVNPPNGIWSGTGITDQYAGTFNPATAGLGHHILTYTINGCSDTLGIDVVVIDAGPDVLICPSSDTVRMTSGLPVQGLWSGPGIVDNGDTTFTFHPALVTPDQTFTQSYSKDGCTDTRTVFFLNTKVSHTPVEFCEYADYYRINPATFSPNIPNGTWSGPGLVGADSINPKTLAVGMNYFYYEVLNNGCVDSIYVRIKAKPNAGLDTTVCPQSDPFPIYRTPSGGSWSGAGITDTIGIFSPAVAAQGAEGTFDIYYDVRGCVDTMRVILTAIDPNFSGLQDIYCLNNMTIPLTPTPTGGTFSGDGITGNSFNPMDARPGQHQVTYTYGTGSCRVTEVKTVTVRDSVIFNFVYDNKTLCYGDSVLVNTTVSGGDGSYKFAWTPNKSSTGQIYIKPQTLTTFTLTVDDQCSVPVTHSATIDVWPEIVYYISVGPPVCYGQNNWAKVDVVTGPAADFKVKWNTSPVRLADSINVVADKYTFEVRNTTTNCIVKDKVTIPYYPLVKANFLQLPEERCVPVSDPSFNWINLSTGADQGTWIVGDTTFPYVPADNPSRTFKDTGEYHIKLFIQNSAGCKDSIETDVCVYPIQQYIFPNAFSPNGDGNNDWFPMGEWVNGKFIPTGFGITDYEMRIFDRWGHLVYQTDASRTPWNGRLMNTGDMLKNGVYLYEMSVYFGPRDIKIVQGSVMLLK
ncbi:MAG: gliding motility-associated C-terminal domain-containing protein [Bacteroidota bacterium]